jgi:hypothetical protein
MPVTEVAVTAAIIDGGSTLVVDSAHARVTNAQQIVARAVARKRVMVDRWWGGVMPARSVQGSSSDR